MNNYFNDYYWIQDRNNLNPNMYEMNKINLFSPKEGFEKGNLFSNLYSEYKNYRPANLTPKNEKERLLLNLQAITFASHELNLYLDLHPEDQSILKLFEDYKNKKQELTKEYEDKYGPLTVTSENNNSTTFNWVNENWPWEGNNV